MSEKQKKPKTQKLTSLCSAADNMTLLIEDLIEKLRGIVAAEANGGDMDAKVIKELVAAMKDLTSVIRNLNDLPTLGERFEMELAEKKLELDKLRFDAGAGGESGDITVTISGELGTWSE